MAKLKPITLESDTFQALKQDMTETINKLIRNMTDFHCQEAAMTVKLSIKLDTTAGLTYPKFKHKVACTVQQKDEKTGDLRGTYTLEKDANGVFGLKPVQVDMFEEPAD